MNVGLQATAGVHQVVHLTAADSDWLRTVVVCVCVAADCVWRCAHRELWAECKSDPVVTKCKHYFCETCAIK